MEQLFTLTGRNLKVYLRDRAAIFFSLLSMLICIALMLLFLEEVTIESITDILSQFPGRDADADEENARLLVLAWTCAGILSINAVTVTLGAYSVMIKDRSSGKLNSICTAPVSRVIITSSYVLFAWIASVIICTLTLVITEIYCVVSGMEPFSFGTHTKLVGMIMVNSFTYAAMMYLLALIAKTDGAWSGLGTVIGTLVGFLGGIYLPIGGLAEPIQNFLKCTPVIYGTAMFRNVMTGGILDRAFAGVPEAVTATYRETMGIDLTVFDTQVSVLSQVLLLLAVGVLLLAAGVLVMRYGKKTDR